MVIPGTNGKFLKSKPELEVYEQLKALGIKPDYEPYKIPYVVPERSTYYVPDFVLPNGIVIEVKGRLLSDDRKKMLLVKEQNPKLDIRFCFQRPKNPINKGAKTTCADWASKNGFLWCDRVIPQAWILE